VAQAAVADLDLVRDGEPAVPPDLGVDRGQVAVAARSPAAATRSAAPSCASISAALNAGFAIFSTPATPPAGSVSRKLLSR
jgi:hypothetical protein